MQSKESAQIYRTKIGVFQGWVSVGVNGFLFIIKIILGKRSIMLNNKMILCTKKLKDVGFTHTYRTLEKALKSLVLSQKSCFCPTKGQIKYSHL